MFKLPSPPSVRAGTSELADFAEILSWRRGKVSNAEIVRHLVRGDENDGKLGIEHDEDRIIENLEEVMNETGRRKEACKTGYPFEHDRQGNVLRRSMTRSGKSAVYIYLLLGTRLNMKTDRVHAGIDGTALLEEMSAFALRAYLGSGNARSDVFGTSNRGVVNTGIFERKVNLLCKEIGEGARFRNLNGGPVQARDAGLDIVGWIPFEDRTPGQLIVFGQCKTDWRRHGSVLDPAKFNKLWMEEPFLVDPLRAYFVSEAVDRSNWKGSSIVAGILFDRCRLVQYYGGLSGDLLSRIRKWTSAAARTLDF